MLIGTFAMANTTIAENPDVGKSLVQQEGGDGKSARSRCSLLLILWRSVKCVGVVILLVMIVDKLYGMKSTYYDEMTPCISDAYQKMVDFQRQFMSLGEEMDLESLVKKLDASYVGCVTSAQLREGIPSENYPGVGDLRLQPAVVRRQYVGDFRYGHYTLPHLGVYAGKLLVRCSCDNRLLDYGVVYE